MIINQPAWQFHPIFFQSRNLHFVDSWSHFLCHTAGPPKHSGLPGRVPVVFEGFKARLILEILGLFKVDLISSSTLKRELSDSSIFEILTSWSYFKLCSKLIFRVLPNLFHMGPFKYYVSIWSGWVGSAKCLCYMLNCCILLMKLAYKVGGWDEKWSKICLRNIWMVP